MSARWAGCVCGSPSSSRSWSIPIGTPYLIRYLSTKSDFLTENKDSFAAEIKPAISRIVQAYKTADAEQRTAVIMTEQPKIVTWIVDKELTIPTDADLASLGVTAAQKALEKERAKAKDSSTTTGGSRRCL